MKTTLFAFLSIALVSCAGQQVDLQKEVREIITSGENSFFVQLGPSTTKVLTSLHNEVDTCKFRERTGDLAGDTGATNLVLVKCGSGNFVVLRVKRDRRKKYHILGYTTHEWRYE